VANDVGEIDRDAPARREYPKALAHAGLDQVVPVLAPREPIVVAVIRNAAVIGWTRDDEMHTPVWQWKCARIAVPHLHATVVVNRLTRCINAQAIGRFSSSSDVNHDCGIPFESAMVRTASSRGRPSAVSHREIQRSHSRDRRNPKVLPRLAATAGVRLR